MENTSKGGGCLIFSNLVFARPLIHCMNGGKEINRHKTVGSSNSHFMNTPLHGSLEDYFGILVFIGVAFGLSILLVGLSLFWGPHKPDTEKLSPYECGFQAFSDARLKFDVRYYLVAILFIIFDLEIAFLFPWSVSLKDIGLFGFWSMMFFLTLLTVGFIYEWRKGALEWE